MPRRLKSAASVGVAEHGNSVVLVTLSSERALLDRRTISLTRGLPTHPYHHEGSWAVGRYLESPWAKPSTLADALALIDRVRRAAEQGARDGLEALAESVRTPIARISIRRCPALPASDEARIRDTRAATMADSVMYREALASAAEAHGWSVQAYERERVFDEAQSALGRRQLDAVLRAMGKAAGAPWTALHKLATAAAIASAR